MGIFFKVEAIVLIEDVVPEEYADFADFMKKTKENYAIVRILNIRKLKHKHHSAILYRRGFFFTFLQHSMTFLC